MHFGFESLVTMLWQDSGAGASKAGLLNKDVRAMTILPRALISCLVAASLMAAGALAPPAMAQDAKASNLGSFKAWTAWKGTDTSGVICYISAEPQSSEPKEVNGKPINRDPAHFLVIHRKGLGTRNEVQTLIGYPFSKDKKPTAVIDGKAYAMLPENQAAWLASEADEDGFVGAMKAGTTLVVKGTSLKGTETTDTYTLAGVTAAMAAIDKACS